MTAVLANHPIIKNYLELLGLSVLGFVMSVLMGLPSEGMHTFLNGVPGVELTFQQFSIGWFVTVAFLGFTFLVTEMIHVERRWLDWPRWAQVHTLLVASAAYGILLQCLKIVMPLWDKFCGV